MKLRRLLLLSTLATACAAACTMFPAVADDSAPPPAAQGAPSIGGWTEYVDSLRDLPARIFAKLPEPMRSDPQVQQEVGRLMLEAIAASTLDAIGGDGDHPQFLPATGQLLNVGQPNADTIYRSARLTPGGRYRLRGQRGSLRMAIIAQSGPSPNEPGFKPTPPGVPRLSNDINALHVDKQGRFDVLLSPSRPAGHKGDWWELQPTTTKLLMRMVNGDWSKEKDLTISIERVDVPVEQGRTSAADLEQRLRRLPSATTFIAALFADHVQQLRNQGFVNKLKVFDTSQLGGLAGQFYYEGAYELQDDEALIVEAKVPAKCTYRSRILTNDLYETTDWYNNQSSLNDSQAKPDRDGVLRIVVSARDPGVPNWLDTAGYPSGAIQGRWFNCETQPVPAIRKLALSELRAALPAETGSITPDERQRLIRERRAELQQRPLW